MHKNGSSNTVWLIEKHTPGKIFDGDTCLWEGQYRIRHLATGRLLAVIMEPGEVEDFNEDVRVRGNDRAATSGASPRAARSGGSFKAPKARERRPSAVDRLLDAAGQVSRRGTMLRASDHYAPDTLFQLVPQYPREGVIGMEMHLRVRHVVSGMWLHIDIAPTDDLTPAQKARVEEERALKTELLLRRGVRGGASPTAGMIISGLGKVSEEAGLPPTEAAGSPKPGLKPTSHFGLRKVADLALGLALGIALTQTQTSTLTST